MIIYKITNIINNKSYIGQTKQLILTRWKQHCQLNRKRSCPLLLNAIKKYGKENFTISEIDKAFIREDLNTKEKYWINFFKSFGPDGYNLTSGGDNAEISTETKQKISNKLKGKPRTDGKGYKNGSVPWNKGKPWSEEIKHKLSISHLGQIGWLKGKKLSEETKRKLSKIKKGVKHPHQFKKIICINNGLIYESLQAAALDLNLSSSKICLVLKQKRKHTKGYVFKYFKE